MIDSIRDSLTLVRNGHRHMTNRTDCQAYPRALKLGLPIGSGMIEFGLRFVLQTRLKQAGTAGLAEHADQDRQPARARGRKPLVEFMKLSRPTSNHSWCFSLNVLVLDLSDRSA